MASVARSHGGDGGGEDPHWGSGRLPTDCQASIEKRRRGKTTLQRFRKEWSDNNERPFPIEFDITDQGTGQAVGPRAKDFARAIGYLIDTHLPYYYDSWETIPKEERRPVWDDLKRYFDIDSHLNSPYKSIVKKGITASLAKRYRDRKYKFREDHFTSRGGVAWLDELRQDPPGEMSTIEWNKHLDYYSTPVQLARSERNATNKAENPNRSFHGTKSYAALRYETRNPETLAYPSVIDTFGATHTHYRDGTVYENGLALHQQMLQLREEQRGLENPLSDEQIMDMVLGTRGGYHRGRGRKLPKVSTTPSSLQNAEIESLKNQVASMNSQVATVNSQMEFVMNILRSQGHQMPSSSQTHLSRHTQQQMDEDDENVSEDDS